MKTMSHTEKEREREGGDIDIYIKKGGNTRVSAQCLSLIKDALSGEVDKTLAAVYNTLRSIMSPQTASTITIESHQHLSDAVSR